MDLNVLPRWYDWPWGLALPNVLVQSLPRGRHFGGGALVCRACAGRVFGLLLLRIPILGWSLPPRGVCQWVDGMGQIVMDSPHGLALFRLGIWTGPFLVGDMDCPLSSWGYGPAPF